MPSIRVAASILLAALSSGCILGGGCTSSVSFFTVWTEDGLFDRMNAAKPAGHVSVESFDVEGYGVHTEALDAQYGRGNYDVTGARMIAPDDPGRAGPFPYEQEPTLDARGRIDASWPSSMSNESVEADIRHFVENFTAANPAVVDGYVQAFMENMTREDYVMYTADPLDGAEPIYTWRAHVDVLPDLDMQHAYERLAWPDPDALEPHSPWDIHLGLGSVRMSSGEGPEWSWEVNAGDQASFTSNRQSRDEIQAHLAEARHAIGLSPPTTTPVVQENVQRTCE